MIDVRRRWSSGRHPAARRGAPRRRVSEPVDKRTGRFVARVRSDAAVGRRRRLARASLVIADSLALAFAFAASRMLAGRGFADLAKEEFVFLATLPGWLLIASLYGLYENDDKRTNHTTTDDLIGIFHLVVVGLCLLAVGVWFTGLAGVSLAGALLFGVFAIVLIAFARTVARGIFRRSPAYRQNAVIVGGGEVGQLVARKILRHPRYGINLLGFVEADPKSRHETLRDVPVLGTPEQLPQLVRSLDVERAVIAFSRAPLAESLAVARRLQALGVQVDVVPRLFEIVDPGVALDSVEGLPVMRLSTPAFSSFSWHVKRTVDVTVAAGALIALAPLFAFIAWRIKRDTAGPVFFRQTRLGMHMKEFTLLKFRTMTTGASDAPHRAYIRECMDVRAVPGANALYKLERTAVTRTGQWLRKTSLDELPQLINVVRGEMSLVGPRPCIPYEIEHFSSHHFERFSVPAGLTGFWQVTARAHSTFAEALEMDVLYTRGRSLGLDLRLLCQTALQVIRNRGTA